MPEKNVHGKGRSGFREVRLRFLAGPWDGRREGSEVLQKRGKWDRIGMLCECL